MSRLFYRCSYNGKECTEVIPKVNDKGTVIQPSHKEIMKKYKDKISEYTLKHSWDACEHCHGCDTISGFCSGKLEIEY